MFKHTAALAVVLGLAAAPCLARDRDEAGTLTFFEADGTTGHDVPLTSVYVPLPPLPGVAGPNPADTADQRSITVTAAIPMPDLALIAWMRDAEHAHRRVLLKINDGGDSTPHVSTLEAADAQLTGLTLGYGGSGRGNETIVLLVPHLTVNGLAAY